MNTCHACLHELTIGKSVGRKDECPCCRVDLHCCLNCAFYDVRASKQCREPMADFVKEKGKANFCDYFVFAESRAGTVPRDVEQSRKTLDELFKK
jgi:hypothetical protein